MLRAAEELGRFFQPGSAGRRRGNNGRRFEHALIVKTNEDFAAA